jgi:hypothetical protein
VCGQVPRLYPQHNGCSSNVHPPAAEATSRFESSVSRESEVVIDRSLSSLHHNLFLGKT